MLKILQSLLLCICIWAVGLLWFITLIPSEPTHDTINTDAIVVLTGGGLRLERGFQLLIEHRSSRIFISGVEDNVTLMSLLHNKEYRGLAEQIPATAIIELGHKARSTIGNAEETAAWLANGHIKTIRLVTGNYHIPRSVYEIGQASPDVTIIAEPVFPKHFENNEWWQWESSIKLVISEYHKYIASIIAHKLLAQTW